MPSAPIDPQRRPERRSQDLRSSGARGRSRPASGGHRSRSIPERRDDRLLRASRSLPSASRSLRDEGAARSRPMRNDSRSLHDSRSLDQSRSLSDSRSIRNSRPISDRESISQSRPLREERRSQDLGGNRHSQRLSSSQPLPSESRSSGSRPSSSRPSAKKRSAANRGAREGRNGKPHRRSGGVPQGILTTPSSRTASAQGGSLLQKFLLLAIFAMLILIVFNLVNCFQEQPEEEHIEGPPPEPISLKVTFAGDCTLGTDASFDQNTSFNTRYSVVGDPAWFFANVEPLFAEDDLTVVNAEGTFTTSKDRQDKTFAFKGDADYAKVFSTSSVEAASVANNHSYDYGQQSFDDTLVALEAEGIESFGYDRIGYLDVKDVKVALIGVNELTFHEEVASDVERLIQEARDNGARLTLVYFHWGIERDYVPNETQIKLAHAAIDAGADAVIGSHPHVIQGWEVYEGRYIVYSLGNFCFGGNPNPSDKDCMIFQQTFTIVGDEVEKNDEVEFIACSISSASGYNNYQPTLASGSEKERIDAKIADSTKKIAEKAAALKPKNESASNDDGEDDEGGEGESNQDG